MPLKIPKKQKIKLKEGRISRLPQKTNLKAQSFYYPVSRKLREIKKKKIQSVAITIVCTCIHIVHTRNRMILLKRSKFEHNLQSRLQD